MRKESLVVRSDQADFRNFMTEHSDSIETETEGEARVLFRIDSAVLEHVRVYGTATADFHPAGALAALATFTAAEDAAHVHFGRRFREREEARTETRFDAFAKELVHKDLENTFQLGCAFPCSESECRKSAYGA